MSRPASRTGVTLAVLTALFFLRVAGQALVAFAGVTWLPPMESWYSGLLPYPLLLPAQIAILIVQALVTRGVWRERGFFARSRPRAGRFLQGFSYVYALAMLIRILALRTHLIPVTFHWVLAAWLFTLGRYWRGQAAAAPRAWETPATARSSRP